MVQCIEQCGGTLDKSLTEYVANLSNLKMLGKHFENSSLTGQIGLGHYCREVDFYTKVNVGVFVSSHQFW